VKKYGFVFIVVIFFLTTCKEQKVITQTQQSISQNGNVSLVFEKTQIPKAVKLIHAVLRKNSDSLVSTLNTTDLGSPEIEFSNVPVGNWKLNIDAMNADNITLYSELVDVTVLKNQVTNVNLVLPQASSGVGGIKITVTYVQTNRWADFSSTPILSPQGTMYDGKGLAFPFVMYDDSIFKMWYSNIQSSVNAKGAVTSVGYATSKNGLTWKHYSRQPVLIPTKGTWDAFSVGHGTILKDSGEYKLYYSGYIESNGSRFSIGLATSTDGIHWTKKAEPILSGSNGWDYSIAVKGVVKVNNKYYMYYHSGDASGIGLATSTDGISWTRYAGNPILIPTDPWEGWGISIPSVIYDEGKFKMVYANTGMSSSFGFATSEDGIHWTKDAGNPIFSKEKTKKKWSYNIGYPSITKVGNKLMIYYMGVNSSNNKMSIGVLVKN